MRLAEGKVDDLEDDKIAAEAYRQKEAQFYRVNINVLKCNKNACEKNIEKLQEILTSLEKKKDYETGKLAKKRDELKELEVCAYNNSHHSVVTFVELQSELLHSLARSLLW